MLMHNKRKHLTQQSEIKHFITKQKFLQEFVITESNGLFHCLYPKKENNVTSLHETFFIRTLLTNQKALLYFKQN